MWYSILLLPHCVSRYFLKTKTSFYKSANTFIKSCRSTLLHYNSRPHWSVYLLEYIIAKESTSEPFVAFSYQSLSPSQDPFKKNWSRVDLKCCVSFRYIAKWFSLFYIYIYSFIIILLYSCIIYIFLYSIYYIYSFPDSFPIDFYKILNIAPCAI